jgi:hypothetical protein
VLESTCQKCQERPSAEFASYIGAKPRETRHRSVPDDVMAPEEKMNITILYFKDQRSVSWFGWLILSAVTTEYDGGWRRIVI